MTAQYRGTLISPEQNRKVEGIWEELPQDVLLAITPETGPESPGGQTASLFQQPSLTPHEKKIYKVLKADEAMPLDEILEKLE